MDNLNQVIIVGKFQHISNHNNIIVKIISDKNNCIDICIKTSKNIINTLRNNCKINDIIGIKGMINTDKKKNLIIYASKISFISNKKS